MIFFQWIMSGVAIFDADEVICGGKWVIRVAYIGLVVHKEIHDLCKEVSCPLPAGKFVLTHTQKLPLLAPPVSFNSPHTCS